MNYRNYSPPRHSWYICSRRNSFNKTTSRFLTCYRNDLFTVNLLNDDLPASVGQFSHLCDRLIVNTKLQKLFEWIHHNQSKVVNSNDCCCHNWLILKRWTRTCQSFLFRNFFSSGKIFWQPSMTATRSNQIDKNPIFFFFQMFKIFVIDTFYLNFYSLRPNYHSSNFLCISTKFVWSILIHQSWSIINHIRPLILHWIQWWFSRIWWKFPKFDEL